MMCRMRTLSLHNDASPSRGAAVDEAGGGAYYAQWVQCLTMHDSLVGADDIEVRRRGAGGRARADVTRGSRARTKRAAPRSLQRFGGTRRQFPRTMTRRSAARRVFSSRRPTHRCYDRWS